MADITKIQVGGVEYNIKDSKAGSGTITAVQANGTNVATSGTANIPAASTSAYGVTKLSSATNSTSTALAATASAVKSAYDLANGKQDKLTSGTNIKTINGQSILGSGNITIEGGGSSSGGGPNVVQFSGSTANITAEDNTIYLTDNYVSTLNLNLNHGYFPVGFNVRFRNGDNIQLNISGYTYNSDLHCVLVPDMPPQLPELWPEVYTEISVVSAGIGTYTKYEYNIVVTQFIEIY